MKKIQAVLTGDLIHSTRMSAEYRTELFKQITSALKQWDKKYDTKSETFRGDSFQSLIKKISDALRIALIQKTFIRSITPSDISKTRQNKNTSTAILWTFYDARIAIGIGEVDVVNKRLAASNGEAFQLSGVLLDKIKNKKQALAIATNDKYNDELETEMILLDAILSKTTPLQCEVIHLKLLGYTEIEIAKRLKIGQSAINQRSNSGNWNAIDAILKRFDKIYS